MALNSTAILKNTNIPAREDTIGFLTQYLTQLPANIIQGDYFSILVSLVLAYLIIVLVNKLTGMFLIVIKKTIALGVTITALLMLYNKFNETLQIEGFSFNTIFIGILGILIAIVGTAISFYSLFSSTKKAIKRPIKFQEKDTTDEKSEIDLNQLKDFKTFFSMDSLKNDKSFLSVLTFLVVAEFGVFSSKTITAPNATIGLVIFVIFLAFSFLFIKQSYKSYTKGITHIIVTLVVGTILAITLGHFWEGLSYGPYWR